MYHGVVPLLCADDGVGHRVQGVSSNGTIQIGFCNAYQIFAGVLFVTHVDAKNVSQFRTQQEEVFNLHAHVPQGLFYVLVKQFVPQYGDLAN